MKTLVVVQCRYNSTRLRGKALYPIAGIPMLVFLIKRLKNGLPEETYRIVLATSKSPHDDIIHAWGKVEEVPVIRGDENDVLQRFSDCLARYPSETVVRVTADNPLTCPEILQRTVDEKIKNNAEYVLCNNTPIGCATDAFSGETLQRLNAIVEDPDEREHINLHILRHEERFKIFRHCLSGSLKRKDLHLTIDTLKDWQRVNRIFENDENEPWNIPLSKTIERMDRASV